MINNIGREHGLKLRDIDALQDRTAEIHKNLKARRKTDPCLKHTGTSIGFYNLPYDKKLSKDVLLLSKELTDRFDNLVVLGIGGSSLGGRALFNALCHPYHNLLPRDKRKGLSVFFCDNIDPDSFSPLLKILNLKKTVFNVITKSGGTAETVAQFLVINDLLKKRLGKKYRNHIVITTDPVNGPLRKIAADECFNSLPVPPNVGGRYSVFSAVGLFPSAMAGVDIKKLLAGARQMDKTVSTSDIWENPAYMSAILQYLAYQKGKNISVIMPYSNALRDFAEWYIQLWAESLGKRVNLKGAVVNAGTTPIKAIGTTDQHSQLQLYTEGPFDKIITFIEVKRFDNKIPIPEIYKDVDGVGYLGGHTMDELFKAEQMATKIALAKTGRMNYTIAIPEITPFAIGQLLFFFEVQTAFAGGLFEVNPFDQPGVEDGKNLAYGIMGKKGYDKTTTEIKDYFKRRDKQYIIG